MRPQAVFLDFGGTLVTGGRGTYPAYEAAFQTLGLPIDPASFARAEADVARTLGSFEESYLGKPAGFSDEYHGRVAGALGSGHLTARVVLALNEAITSPRVHIPYPETNDVLRALRHEGIPLHLVSNNTEHLVETVRRLGWGRDFATITFSQEAGAAKPDARIFRLALQRAGCAPGDVVHVGDSWEADILGARALGLRALWIDRIGTGAGRAGPRALDLRGVLTFLGSP